MHNFLYLRKIYIGLQAVKSDGYCLERSISWWVYGSERYFVYVLAHIQVFLESNGDLFAHLPLFDFNISHELKRTIISRCKEHGAKNPNVEYVDYWPIVLNIASHVYQRKFGILKWTDNQWTN